MAICGAATFLILPLTRFCLWMGFDAWTKICLTKRKTFGKALVDMESFTFLRGCHISQLVQDFCYEEYGPPHKLHKFASGVLFVYLNNLFSNMGTQPNTATNLPLYII